MSIQNDNGTYTKKGENIPYTSPTALCDETKNKLFTLAQEEADKVKKTIEIWCWNITSDACSFALSEEKDPDAIYSQDPSNFLLATVYPKSEIKQGQPTIYPRNNQ